MDNRFKYLRSDLAVTLTWFWFLLNLWLLLLLLLTQVLDLVDQTEESAPQWGVHLFLLCLLLNMYTYMKCELSIKTLKYLTQKLIHTCRETKIFSPQWSRRLLWNSPRVSRTSSGTGQSSSHCLKLVSKRTFKKNPVMINPINIFC